MTINELNRSNCNEITITPSIGISLSPKDGRNRETLIKHADLAMYRAKEKGKNMYHFFSLDFEGIPNSPVELAKERGLYEYTT